MVLVHTDMADMGRNKVKDAANASIANELTAGNVVSERTSNSALPRSPDMARANLFLIPAVPSTSAALARIAS